MTNDWNDRKGLVIVLGLVALGVWGYTLLTFTRGVSAVEALPSPPATTSATLAPHYEDPGRDPFEPPIHLDPDLAGLTSMSSSGGFAAWSETAAPLGGASGDPLPAASPPSDRPIHDPSDVPPPPPELGPPACRLVGIVGHSALLITAQGRSVTVYTGDLVDGYVVASVSREGVTLSDGPRSHLLTL